MSTFHALFNRLLNLPLTKQEYNKERNTIINIAINNGYQKYEVLKILNMKKEHRENLLLFKGDRATKNREKWISVPYSENIADTTRKILQQHLNINVTYNSSKNLGKTLINTRDPQKTSENSSGIYRIDCECSKKYVGQTGRGMSIRMREHLASARLRKQGHSSFSDHLLETKHDPNKCTSKLLKACKKGKLMSVWEQWEINKLKNTGDLLNTQIESQVAHLIMPPSLCPLRKDPR